MDGAPVPLGAASEHNPLILVRFEVLLDDEGDHMWFLTGVGNGGRMLDSRLRGDDVGY
jgi:hypothetical protein